MDGTTEYPLLAANELTAEAWAAMGRQDGDRALELWCALREQFPERPEGYVWPIQVLWQNGRNAEAEEMAAEAFSRFPDHPEIFVQRAWIASTQQDWDEAAERWAMVREKSPERPEGYVWGARASWQAGRADEAETIVATGLARAPDNPDMLAESAWVATTRQDWPKALLRWSLVRDSYPERLDAQVGAIRALRMVGRIDEAEAIASAALARHPDDTDFLIEHLWLAVARGDWPEVPGRLEHARRIAREPARFDQSVRWIDERLALLSKQAATTPAAPAVLSSLEPEAEADEVSPTSLMLAFESIGERCDFGAVQRHFGVEPLGLLRFAWTRFDSLIAALEDRFEAVGTVEDTEFALYGDETILRMKKYGLIFHTFIYRMDEEPPEKREAFYQQQRRRLLFLKDKLVADLQDPQKICVYSTNEWAADDHITRLASALRAYGPSSLLYVRPERDKRPSGFVEALEDGLYAGYFPGLAEFVRGGQPPFELWRQLCARTFRLSRAGSDNAGFLKTLL